MLGVREQFDEFGQFIGRSWSHAKV